MPNNLFSTPVFSSPISWLLSVLGAITLGWVGTTTKKVNEHSVKIAKLEERDIAIKESLDRLETHFGTKPRE